MIHLYRKVQEAIIRSLSTHLSFADVESAETKAMQQNFLRTSNSYIYLLRVWCWNHQGKSLYDYWNIFSAQVKIHFCNCEIRRALMNFKSGFALILLTNCIFTYWTMWAYDFSLIGTISKVINWCFSLRQQNSTLINISDFQNAQYFNICKVHAFLNSYKVFTFPGILALIKPEVQLFLLYYL